MKKRAKAVPGAYQTASRMKLLAYTVPFLMGTLVSCNDTGEASGGDREKFVSRAMFGKQWPLTVASGTLKCLDYGGVVFITDDGTIYGVNGTAKTHGRSNGYADIDAIWADDIETKKQLMAADVSEKNATSKMNIGPLLDEGLKLCE